MTERATTSSVHYLGERMKTARDEAGLTIAQVARELDVDVRTVTRWQANASQPSYERLAAFAALVGKPPSYFLDVAAA